MFKRKCQVLGQKGKLLYCPQVEFLKIWVGWSENMYFFKSTEKFQIWVHFPHFSQKM